MSKLTTGYTLGITKDQFRAVTYLAEGWPYERIACAIWDVTDGNGRTDAEKMKKAKKKLGEWFHSPKVMEAYRTYVKDEMLPVIMRSLKRIDAQIDDENGWLSNKAANDILTRYGNILFGEEDKTVRVQIVGMPELGEPDD